MKEEILQEIGLSKNEAKVYTVLLKEGSSPATNIMKICELHRSNVYDALEGLRKKGLVGYILIGDIKFFKATNPQNLMEMLRRRKIQLTELIPNMKAKNKEITPKTKIRLYKGYKDLKNLMTHFVEIGDEYLSIGIPSEFPEHVKSWLSRHHRERIENKVKIKIIFDEDTKERARIVNQMELAEAKYFPKELSSPVTTEVCGDEFMIIHWAEEPIIIHMECPEIAQSYKNYFKLLWNMAKGFSEDTNETSA